MAEGATVHFDFDDDLIDELFDQLDVVAIIEYTADYAAFVNFPTAYTGTQPPFEPLFEWVQRKWNDLDDGLKDVPLFDEDGNRTAIEEGSIEHKRAVAWVVVISIASDGTDGVFFMERSFEAAKQAGEQFLDQYEDTDDIEAARKVITDTVDFAFTTSQDIIAQEASDRGNLLQSGRAVVVVSGNTEWEQSGGVSA